MTEQDFETLIARGYELNGVEFKGPGKRSDKRFMAKVTRAVLAMANRRDGGLVIIGVEEGEGALDPVGLSEDQIDTWKSFDKLSTAINEYARPSVSFDRDIQNYKENTFIIIRVSEFDDVPIFCQGDYHDPAPAMKKSGPLLRRGACYLRTRNTPGTSEIHSEEEMRELLDLAIEKGVRKFLERARRVGLYRSDQATPAVPPDEERFEKQKEELQ